MQASCRLTSCAQVGSVPRPSVVPACVQTASVSLSDRRSSSRTASCSAASGDGPSWSQAICSSLLAVALVCGSPYPALASEGLAQKAVAEYVDLDSQGKLKGGKALEDLRQKYRVRRGADGRVQLRSSRGEWFQCRLDMEVPGSMLLRDSKGYVYAIQTDAIQQIDLSDDLVILMMFADGEWEKQMAPVEFIDDKGATQHLSLLEKEFREVIGILKETQDLDAGKQQ